MEILIGIVGLLVGAVIGYILATRGNDGKRDALRDQVRNEMLQQQEQLLKSRDEQQEQLLKSRKEQEERMLEQQETRHREAMEAMNARFEETIAKMREEVVNVTNRMLKEQSQEFGVQSKERLDQLMKPLRDDLQQMQIAVKTNTDKTTDYNGQLKAGIENVLRQSEAARESAEKLASALSAGTKLQGHWGERILSEILETTGLREGIHYDTQSYIRDDNGQPIKGECGTSLQPDVILHLDHEHHVIIDSKVSLTAFLRYNEAETEAEKSAYLKEHITSLRNHVRGLARKDYSTYLKGSLDYVIMFVPITQALYLATANDHSLWREAMEQKVYIADEQTIYAALKIISLNWKQQAQAENHEQVYKLANEMLDRVGQFLEKFSDMGEALNKAQKAYDESVAKLSDGGQSIPVTSRKLIKLGASYNKGRRKGKYQNLLESGEENPQLPE